jgi:hypothetical protein
MGFQAGFASLFVVASGAAEPLGIVFTSGAERLGGIHQNEGHQDC